MGKHFLSQSNDLTVGDHKKVLIDFAVPVFLSMLFQQLYNSVDSLIVGNFLGKESLAAVSSSGSLIFLFISFFTGMSMGGAVVIARYFGEGKFDNVTKAIHSSVLLALISGIVLAVAGVALSPQILVIMGTAENVLPESIAYFKWYFVGAPTVVMYNTFKGIMNALGDSRRPLIYLIISSLLNIALDLFFVGALRLGIAWAAVATTIAQAFSVILCLIHLTKKNRIYTLSFKNLRFDRKMTAETIRYGLPTGIQNSVIGFANVMVQANINSFGDDAMAACGSYAKTEGFAFMPITSFSMALTTFIGQNLGAGKKDRARQGARFGILSGMILAEMIGVIVFAFGPLFIAAYNRDPEVIRIGTMQARIESLFFFLLAFSHCVAAICRGAGKAFVPMTIMLSVWCVLRIIYITVAMHFCHDIRLLFVAYPLTWTISSIIYLIYYKKSRWIDGFDLRSPAVK